jgi:hypothetical protein
MSDIKRKVIVFNMEDPLQRKLWEHCNNYKNFSYYGKSLIQRDMDANPVPVKKQIVNGIEIKVGNNETRYL